MVRVGTKKAGNVGAVARACGSFECEDLRLVAPRCDPDTRASLSARLNTAQHIVHGAGVYDTLDDALLDVDTAVAFGLVRGRSPPGRATSTRSCARLLGGAKTKEKTPFFFHDDARRPARARAARVGCYFELEFRSDRHGRDTFSE